MERDLAARNARLEAAHAVSQEIVRELDLDGVLDLVLRHARAIMGPPHGRILLWDAAAEQLETRAAHGLTQRPGEGIVGRAAELKRPVMVDGYDPATINEPATLHEGISLGPGLAMPILVQQRLVGVPGLGRPPGVPPFHQDDVDALSLLVDQMAVAIENAEAYRVAERRIDLLRQVRDLAESVSASLDLDAVLARSVEGLTILTDAPMVSIWLADEAERMLRLAAIQYPANIPLFASPVRRLRDSGTGWVGKHRTTLDVPDVFVDDRFNDESVGWAAEHHLSSYLGRPVLIDGRLVAVIAISSRRPLNLSEDDRAALDMFIAQVAVGIRNAELHAHVAEANE